MTRIETVLPAARRRLLRIGDDRQLTEAAALLSEPNRHMVVVCNRAGAMVGIVTRTDIVRQIRHCRGCACTAACAMVMTTQVISCQPDDRLQDVWSLMRDKGFQSVPIVDTRNKPIGLLSAADALERLLSDVEYEEELLKDYVMCVGYR
ncbi:MAG: CBS domain-containing protein [Rhizobiaceae bacterium]|nr:CBS domain-containing protein [Rhizobiaceae bacterium]